MPIYDYRCTACGYENEVLQKMSDAPLTECPQCKQSTLVKKVTAAGFQLKGSGWYVTDFRGGSGSGNAAPGKTADADGAGGDAKKGAEPKAAESKPDTASSSGTDSGGSSTGPTTPAGTT